MPAKQALFPFTVPSPIKCDHKFPIINCYQLLAQCSTLLYSYPYIFFSIFIRQNNSHRKPRVEVNSCDFPLPQNKHGRNWMASNTSLSFIWLKQPTPNFWATTSSRKPQKKKKKEKIHTPVTNFLPQVLKRSSPWWLKYSNTWSYWDYSYANHHTYTPHIINNTCKNLWWRNILISDADFMILQLSGTND